MALSIKDILELAKELPEAEQRKFIELLQSMTLNQFHELQEQARQQQLQQQQTKSKLPDNVTGQPQQGFRKPPFLSDTLSVGRNQKLFDDAETQEPKKRPPIK